MKKLLTILTFLVLTNSVNAQLDTTKLDTVCLFVHALDTTHYWSYYKQNGVLAWGNVKEYNVSLIPVGGTAVMGKEVHPFYSMINGFGVIKSDTIGNIKVVRWLDANKKEIKDRWIAPLILIR